MGVTVIPQFFQVLGRPQFKKSFDKKDFKFRNNLSSNFFKFVKKLANFRKRKPRKTFNRNVY